MWVSTVAAVKAVKYKSLLRDLNLSYRSIHLINHVWFFLTWAKFCFLSKATGNEQKTGSKQLC